MAKEKAEIVGSVRHTDGVVYTPGMEDELAKALNRDQLERLAEKGVITGPWTAGKKTEPAKQETAKETEKEPKTEK